MGMDIAVGQRRAIFDPVHEEADPDTGFIVYTVVGVEGGHVGVVFPSGEWHEWLERDVLLDDVVS